VIVLDTNVLSETLRPAPAPAVMAWLDAQPRQAMFTTAVTRGEVLYGVALLPEGRRRDELQAACTAIFDIDMAGRVLAFDTAAADAYAAIAAGRRDAGRPISQFDAMIAGIARAHGATVATRNITDFEGCGVLLVDPWEFQA
jgi:predicted nucleic acid-binding protein